MGTKKCTELAKFGDRSVVEVFDMEDHKITKYVVCRNFDNAKEYGNKWDSGHHFDIWDSSPEDVLKSAMLELYDVDTKKPAVPYDRVKELAKYFYGCSKELAEDKYTESEMKDCFKTWKEYLGITNEDAELLNAEDDFFEQLFKVVNVTFTREQRVTVQVIMPNDEPDCNAEDYVENKYNLEDEDDNDWECDDYNVYKRDMTEEDINREVDLDEVWNGCDFPDCIG